MDFTKKLLKYRIISMVLTSSSLIIFGIILEINRDLTVLAILIVIIIWCIALYVWTKHRCPICNTLLEIGVSYTYCPHCGTDLTNIDEDMLE